MNKVLQEIEATLGNKKLRKFLKSLFIDTRLTDSDMATQIYIRPEGFEAAVAVAVKYHAIFGGAIRGAFPELHMLSLRIDETDDDIERLALWTAFSGRLAD